MRPAHFGDKLPAPAALDRCESCYNAPTDRLHCEIRGGCNACHQTDASRRATVDPDEYFVLDRDHFSGMWWRGRRPGDESATEP